MCRRPCASSAASLAGKTTSITSCVSPSPPLLFLLWLQLTADFSSPACRSRHIARRRRNSESRPKTPPRRRRRRRRRLRPRRYRVVFLRCLWLCGSLVPSPTDPPAASEGASGASVATESGNGASSGPALLEGGQGGGEDVRSEVTQ